MNPTTSELQTIDETSAMSSIRSKLKFADSDIQLYVVALEKENLKLHKQIAKLQVENVSANNRVRAAEELKKIPTANVEINL